MAFTSALPKRFHRLSEVAQFYCAISALMLALGVATGLAGLMGIGCRPGIPGLADGGPSIDLNPRTPIFSALSPWGHVVNLRRVGLLEAPFEILGVLTPIPQDANSFSSPASPGEDLGGIAARLGIDLDLLASANSSSYARVTRRATDLRLPLLYSRERSWDRSLEFLYPTCLEVPFGGNQTARGGAPTITKHTVQSGESLWNIAQKYHVKIETIVAMNDLPNARFLKMGQILEVPDTDGSLVTVRRGDTVEGLCKRYSVDITELVNSNPGLDITRLIVNQKLFIPGLNALEQLFRFIWPVHGRISGRYGHRYHPIFHRRMMHTGLDIAARYGTTIGAAMDGRVTFVGTKGGYGKTIIIEHANGYETLYGHCSKILVKRGQTVKKGQAVGKVGSTGYSTGPHLHFEVRRHGKRMNPEKVLS